MKINARGFTLVEILVALTITGIIMISVYAAFRGGLTGYFAIDSTLSKVNGANAILDMISNDLRCAIPFNDTDTFFQGTGTDLKFAASLREKGMFDSIRQFVLVGYRNENSNIMRHVRVNHEVFDESNTTLGTELADNSTLFFQYGYYGLDSNELQFKDAWAQDNDEEKKQFPSVVKVNVSLGDKDKVTYERFIYLSYNR